MRDQTAREANFPVACARCGGRISEPVSFCPHCGAHARFALADSAAGAGSVGQPARGPAASARVEPRVPSYEFEGDLDPPWPGPPTPLFASPDGDPYGQVRAPSGHGWGLKAGTVLVVAAFVILYGGAVAVHRFDGASPLSSSGSSKAVEGTIGANGGNDSNFATPSGRNARSSSDAPPPKANDSTPPDMSIASLPPPAATMQPQPSATVAPPPQPNVAPQAQASVAPPPAQPSVAPAQQSVAPPQAQANLAPSPSEPAQPQAQERSSGADDSYANGRSLGRSARSEQAWVSGSQVANAQQHYRNHRGDAQSGRVAAQRALNTAQALFAKNDLRGARASLDRALVADPSNGEALGLRDELMSREQERDAALNAAHDCVVQSRWTCVWHNAGKALAADASSTEARALVNRAIVESGAATAPAGPGPDTVEVPMVQ